MSPRTVLLQSLLPLLALATFTAPAVLGAKPQADEPAAVAEGEKAAAAVEEAPPDDDFRRKGREIMKSLDDAYGEGFFTYFFDDGIMPRPYLVAAENKKSFDPDTLNKEYAEILGYLYQEFYRQYRDLANLKDIREPVPVIVFDSRDAYKKVRESKPELGLANEEFMAGYFVPSTGVLYQWRQDDLWHVMFHEGTHQLVEFATGSNVSQLSKSPWLQEGIADYFGGHESKLEYSEEKKGFVRTFQLGEFIQDRFSTVQTALLGGRALPLKELVGMDFMSFKGAQNSQEGNQRNQEVTGLVYAQGWALVMFLNRYDGGKYKPLFEEFLKLELKGQGNLRNFSEIFSLETDEDWEDFDAEYQDFVQTDLRRMRLKSAKKS